jgi:C4-dicarboxylate-specific signal transduction histidine kinase
MRFKPAFRGISEAGLLPPVTLAVTLAIFTADTLTPPDCVVSGLYVVVTLLAGRFWRGAALWGVCLGCAGLTIAAQLLAYRQMPGITPVADIGAFNSAVSILTVMLTGYLVTRGHAAEAVLRQAQTELAHTSRITTMGELTASIAHEVNQPIAAIVTNASACLRWLANAGDATPIQEAREAAGRIVRDGTRASEIISRIRKMFVKGSAERQPTNINHLVQETIGLLNNQALRHSVAIRTELATNIPQISGDAIQLQQVMVNLITNGIDAMRDAAGSRELIVRSWQPDNKSIAVSVSDIGVGLPAGQVEQIFNAFFTTKSHGTGLGLAISRTIVADHNGELTAAPNRPRGAVFQFVLPIQSS